MFGLLYALRRRIPQVPGLNAMAAISFPFYVVHSLLGYSLLRVLMEAEATSYAEVSEAFGMPIGSIGPTRMRCLNQLRRFLDAADYSFDLATES